ncbi:MAG: hypothetical protein ACRD1H_15085, partial [Vicinamibacterales bacterium]
MRVERLRAGAPGGLAGGAAFAAVMKLEIALSCCPADDFLLLGGFGPLKDRWRVTDPIIHGINSIALGILHAFVSDRVCGPPWRRGVTFALIENTLLWPIIVVLDYTH